MGSTYSTSEKKILFKISVGYELEDRFKYTKSQVLMVLDPYVFLAFLPYYLLFLSVDKC